MRVKEHIKTEQPARIFDFGGMHFEVYVSSKNELDLSNIKVTIPNQPSRNAEIIHQFAVLNKLRRRYPAARLDWLVTPAIGELLTHNPAISNVIEFDRDQWSAPWRPTPYLGAAKLIAMLRAAQYDLVLDLQGQFDIAMVERERGAEITRRVRPADAA